MSKAGRRGLGHLHSGGSPGRVPGILASGMSKKHPLGRGLWLIGRRWIVTLAVIGGATTASSGRACSDIPGLGGILEHRKVLVVGEMHGTEESPAFVAEVICQAASSGRSVTLGLELLDSERSGIDTYLDSERTAADKARLTGTGAWSAEYQDGRTSGAILELLERVAEIGAGGASIDVELFDRGGWKTGQERDRLMAEALAGIVDETTSDLVVILTGNIHSRVSRGTPWDQGYEPMAYLLSKKIDKELLALDVSHAGGTAWICTGAAPSSCGVKRVNGRSEGAHPAITLGTDPATTGHHGRYHVGSLTASPPAAGDP